VGETSESLLDRLRGRADEGAWRRLLAVYEPFVRGFLRDPALRSDIDDLVQDILAVLVRDLPTFRRQRCGSFRAWLRTITVNRLNEWWRRQRAPPAGGSQLDQLADPASALSRLWDAEHDRHVARRLLALLEPEFSPGTWRAFRRQALDGAPAEDVAAELGASVNAVLIAKSRVLRRLREEAGGLLDD
jgi:RNA polymerase sigma-70 factor (ECF subfamily)